MRSKQHFSNACAELVGKLTLILFPVSGEEMFACRFPAVTHRIAFSFLCSQPRRQSRGCVSCDSVTKIYFSDGGGVKYERM